MTMNSLSHLLLVLVLLIFLFRYGNSGNTLRGSDKLVSGRHRTLVSLGDAFEAGFFKFAASERWYVGIWYKNIPKRTYVWVANRQSPLFNSNGALEISKGNLVIRDQSNRNVVWSSKTNERNERPSVVVAQLLDNGNFVLREANNSHADDYLWQSFDEPTDTILPAMKLSWDSQKVHINKILTSWRSVDDPAPGNYFFRFETLHFPVLSTWHIDSPVYRSGPWNGIKFIGAPSLFRLRWSTEQIPYLSITKNNRSYTRVQVDHMGFVRQYTWSQSSREWDEQWISVLDHCDLYRMCSPNAYCAHDVTSPTLCECIQGFENRDDNLTRTECVRKKPMTCNGDQFSKLVKMNLPDTSKAKAYPVITETKQCRNMCLMDCSCTAFTISNSLQTGTPSCITWNGDLVDIRSYSDEGLDLYVRVGGKKKSKTGLIIGFSVGIPAVTLFSLAIFCYWKKKHKRARATAAPIEMMMPMERANAIEDQLFAPMEFGMILKATDNFSQEIGHGGFGKVYKGLLANGEQIAVKKLSELSKQGPNEFYTEVTSISRLRHINIVRLYGWSVHKEERLLIYEYLQNGSLDRHLFGGELNWQRRYHIIKGVAKGLAYIEEGSYDMIVHRDLKPENILLDRDMTPKISDFGLARMCARSENEAFTEHAAGTRYDFNSFSLETDATVIGTVLILYHSLCSSYMSPEYLIHGIISAQTDIYSFGVTVLEIVSGRKNRSFSSYMGRNINLLGYAWNKYNEGSWNEIVDEKVTKQDSLQSWQVLRCIEVGLLCSQQNARDRPKMSVVVAMLEDQTLQIQKPKLPGFYTTDEGQNEIHSSSNTYGESSMSTSYQFTSPITEVQAR